MALDSLTANTAATATSATAKTTGTNKTAELTDAKGTQDRFIKLLVTQLQNQDPLSPMDNSQVTSQMAQLNTVSGIQSMNDTMKSMASTFTSGQTLQATSMLGRTVMFEGNSMTLKNGKATGAIDLAQAADKVTVEVKNSDGKVVHTADLGFQQAGLHDIQWDGVTDDGSNAPPGSYTFNVTAKAAGVDATFTPLSVASVQGVTQAADGVRLLTDNSGEQKLSDVKRIF